MKRFFTIVTIVVVFLFTMLAYINFTRNSNKSDVLEVAPEFKELRQSQPLQELDLKIDKEEVVK